MFDIGFNEIFVVGLVVLVVTGPNEIPKVLKTTARIIRKIRSTKSQIQDKVDDFLNMDEEHNTDLKQALDLADVKKLKADLENQLAKNFNPIKEQLDHLKTLEHTITHQQHKNQESIGKINLDKPKKNP